MKKKIFCVLWCVLYILCLFNISIVASTNNHTQSEAVNWANSQVGKYLDYDGAYGAQCVDLIKYYYKYLGCTDYARGNGKDYATNSLPSGWTRIQRYSGFEPQPGDVAVWTSGTSGHVAIITSGNSSSINVVEQNWPSGSACSTRTSAISAIWGVIRPDFTNVPEYLSDPLIYNASVYRTLNSDLEGFSDSELLHHWINHGIPEGRRASYVFDVKQYINYNGFQDYYGTNYVEAINHFLTYGINEGRRSCMEFNVATYKAANSDLSFGTNREYYEHFLNYGVHETRTSSPDYSALYYMNNYYDIRESYGTKDCEEYMKHWLLYGKSEGRIAGTRDTKPPTISDVTVANVTSSSYTVSCKVADDLVGVRDVYFANFTWKEGGEGAQWVKVTPSNGKYTYTVKASDHGNLVNAAYNTHIYAYDRSHSYSDNIGSGESVYKVSQFVDAEAPKVTAASLTNVSDSKCRFQITATDNVGVDHVDFHVYCDTWTASGETVYKAIKSGNNWYYDVPLTLSNGKTWTIDARAFDAAGNQPLTSSGYAVTHATLHRYNVSFNANDGNCSTSSKNIIRAAYWIDGNSSVFIQSYGSLPTPTRDGYTFDGWYTSASGGTKVTGDSKVTATTDHTLYAHWTKMYYLDMNGYLDGEYSGNIKNYGTADIYINGELNKDDVADYWYQWQQGSSYEIKDIHAYPGYVYRGVMDESQFKTLGIDTPKQIGNAKGTLTNDTMVVLMFDAETYTVTFDANADDVNVIPSGKEVKYNSEYGDLPEPVRYGYRFDGWYTEEYGGTKIESDTKITNLTNHVLYAHWTPMDVPDPTPTPTIPPAAETDAPTETPTPTAAPPTAPPTPTPYISGTTISAGGISAKPGDTVEVPIRISDNTGFANISLEIDYDSDVMTLADVKNNTEVGATFVKSQANTVKPFVLTWNSVDNNVFNGTLATLTFEINSEAEEGDCTVSVDYYKGSGGKYTDGADVNYDEDFKSLGLSYSNGTVTVSKHVPGDIDGDGIVNAKDGTFLLRKLAGWNVEADDSVLDVNGDSVFNAKDGTTLLRWLAGWEIEIF